MKCLTSVNIIFKNFNETLDLNVTTQTAMDYSKNVSIRKITLCYQVHKRDLPKKGNFLNAARTKYFQANTQFWGHFTPHNKWRIRLSLEFHLIKVIQATNVPNFLVSVLIRNFTVLIIEFLEIFLLYVFEFKSYELFIPFW